MDRTELTPEYQAALYSKYKIVDRIKLLTVDYDFKLLEEWLIKSKKDFYCQNERYIIEHFDTDYYLPEFPYGVSLYNLINAFKKIDIPLFTLLIVTNSFGIKDEINALIPNPADNPTVIYTFISQLHYTNNYNDQLVDADKITIPGICMIGRPRVHRHALYNFFANNQLLNLLAVSK